MKRGTIGAIALAAAVLFAGLAFWGGAARADLEDPDVLRAKAAADKYQVEEAVALYSQAIASGRLTKAQLEKAYAGRAAARENHAIAFTSDYATRDAALILALRDYQKARDVQDTWDFYLSEAQVFIALGGYDEAMRAYREAFTREGWPPHWSTIGYSRVERIQKHYDAAMKHLDTVLTAFGGDTASMPIFYHRAMVFYLMGDNAAVVDAIARGLKYQPDYAYAFLFRACAQARLGALDAALADAALAIAKHKAALVDDPWAATPYGQSDAADFERVRATIAAMKDGRANESDKAALCATTWDDGERLRPRSPLLDAR